MAALLFPNATTARRALGQAAIAAVRHGHFFLRNADSLGRTLAQRNWAARFDRQTANSQFSTAAVVSTNRELSGAVEHTNTKLSRELALAALDQCVATSDLADTEVALGLVQVLKSQHVWEDCINCLNLLLNVRPDLFGKNYTDKRFTQVGGSMLSNADQEVLCALLEAILSARFAALPDRRLAGLTAIQVLCDYGVSTLDPELGPLHIRALGFASDAAALDNALKELLPHGTLSQSMQYEIALAYARCLQPEAALEHLATVGNLAKELQIEAQTALSLSFAERADMDRAYELLTHLSNNESLWTSEQTTYDKVATVCQLELRILHASMLSVIPRLPFTKNFHTYASRHCSRVYTTHYDEKINGLLAETIARLRKHVDRGMWKRLGIDRLVFSCECLAYAMAQTAGTRESIVSLSDLRKRLHSLERDMALALTQLRGDGEKTATVHTLEPSSAPLRQFLWAIALATKHSQHKRLEIIRAELEHAARCIPGFVPSVADLEPALVTALPSNMWKTSCKGNFKSDAAFMLSDEFLCKPTLTSAHPYTAQLMQLAQKAWRKASSDHRLFPLCIWIAVTQGAERQALSILNEAFEVAQIRIKPGSLALVHSRDMLLYEQLFAVLSQFKQGAKLATSKVFAAMRQQSAPVALAPRNASMLLYCCVQERNWPVAGEVVSALESLPDYAIPPKIQELYMRVAAVCGQTAKALSIFHHLNYGARYTQINEPSFALLILHSGDSRASAADAERVFDVWVRIMDHQGRATVALVQKWDSVNRVARSRPNPFLPVSGAPLEQVLESVGIARCAPGSLSNKHFLRDWEYSMIMALVGSYIRAGLVEQAAVWEQWILAALRDRQLHLSPSLIASTAHVQRRHLKRDTWDGMKACLDYLVAIDKNIPVGLFLNSSFYKNQALVLQSIAAKIRDDANGALSSQIKHHLVQNSNAQHIFDKIRKLA
ncbi:hypothetical protein GGI04_000177 [Coemansia thaxteri]|nr:hypothetical protein GGI04_000177 [Coemansia thaxteri]